MPFIQQIFLNLIEKEQNNFILLIYFLSITELSFSKKSIYNTVLGLYRTILWKMITVMTFFNAAPLPFNDSIVLKRNVVFLNKFAFT